MAFYTASVIGFVICIISVILTVFVPVKYYTTSTRGRKDQARASPAQLENALTAKQTELDATNKTIAEKDVVRQQQNVDPAQTLKAMHMRASIADKERALQHQKCSNTKTMSRKMKSISDHDQWDVNAKGQWIAVDKNVIKCTGSGDWSSVYGKVVCKSPHTYHWRLRIKTYADLFMFGVAKMSNGDKCKDTYLGSDEVGYYASDTNYAHIFTTGTGQSGYGGQGYGRERLSKSGDVMDMCLDLKEYTLSFKTGGQDTGVCIRNLPREQYRMIVTLIQQPQEIELVAFNCN